MIQDIITYVIIAASAGYVIYNIYTMIFPSKKNPAQSPCGGCAGCQVKNFKGLTLKHAVK